MGDDNKQKQVRVQEADRSQLRLMPVDLDRLISDDHQVRSVWAFVEGLNLGPFHRLIKAVEGEPGRSPIDPKILILDDATSSVDTETEYEIQQALQSAMEGRTTFVIAHRLLSLKNADEILVLDSGRIIERGNHRSLLALGGAYARIYELQLKDQEEFAAVAD